MRYNGMAHSYRSSRCEATSTLAARRYAWPCWDGVPEGGVAYTAYKLIYDTARLSPHPDYASTSYNLAITLATTTMP